jgi:hypothetical protein
MATGVVLSIVLMVLRGLVALLLLATVLVVLGGSLAVLLVLRAVIALEIGVLKISIITLVFLSSN